MRATFLVLMVLLAGCDDLGPRRYELVTDSGSVYLLDTKSGKVWQKTSGAFEPIGIMPDLSTEAKEAKLKAAGFTRGPNGGWIAPGGANGR